MSLKTQIQTRVILWIYQRVPTCAEMARLSSRNLDQPVSLKVRIQMRVHKLICAWCARYDNQLRILRTVMQNERAVLGKDGTVGLSREAKQRIKQSLATKL